MQTSNTGQNKPRGFNMLSICFISASRSGLQELVKICEKFAKKKYLKFSTNADPKKSKTKCIIFSKKPVDSAQVALIMLNGDPLPLVPHLKHLGNELQCDKTTRRDLAKKRPNLPGNSTH